MKSFLSSSWQTVVLWKLAIARFWLYIVSTVCSVVLATLTCVDWSTLSEQKRVLIVVGIVGAICTNISAFLDKTTAQIKGASNAPDSEVKR